MICLNDLMLVILYLLLSILVVVLIILGLKLLNTIDKVNKTIDDVNARISSFDGLLSFVETTGNYVNSIGEKTVGFLYDKFSNILDKKKGEKENEEEKIRIRKIVCRSSYWSWLRSFIRT